MLQQQIYRVRIRNYELQTEYLTSECFNTVDNCLNNIQEYYENYIFDRQGNNSKIEYFKQSPSKKEFKEGYYVKNEEYLNYKIYNRTRDIGYIWNSYTDKKIFSVSIVKLNNKDYNYENKMKELFCLSLYHLFDYGVVYNEVINELKKGFNNVF